jgi:hypothetical protein
MKSVPRVAKTSCSLTLHFAVSRIAAQADKNVQRHTHVIAGQHAASAPAVWYQLFFNLAAKATQINEKRSAAY